MTAPQPFPRPPLTLPAWLLTGHVTPTPAQVARLQAAVDAAITVLERLEARRG